MTISTPPDPSSPPAPSRPRVFISYSHDSPAHAERVRQLATRLVEEDGLAVVLDQWEPNPAEGWERWMAWQVREADFVLVVSTETYARRWRGEEVPERGHGVAFESVLVVGHLYRDKMVNHRFCRCSSSGTTGRTSSSRWRRIRATG